MLFFISLFPLSAVGFCPTVVRQLFGGTLSLAKPVKEACCEPEYTLERLFHLQMLLNDLHEQFWLYCFHFIFPAHQFSGC